MRVLRVEQGSPADTWLTCIPMHPIVQGLLYLKAQGTNTTKLFLAMSW